ncbi:MAG: 16S rRNA (cytosine(1402)-N(4))-methyltransferase RsmH [Desulfobulbus oligotrophicus]|jgi:16S rRNA (cytosine1402-N4)-methyltransferase|nr:16S rRNA (cytosine(1402)-N(4))-methyltransferase RsmH [Desulfobulbus oligotrophicus]
MYHAQRPVHTPVLLDEVVAWLQLRQDGLYVDGTIGLGGHAEAILDGSGPNGHLIGFEWDRNAAALAIDRLSRFGDRVQVVQTSYVNLVSELARLGVQGIDGLVVDLGVSSLQLDSPERGFSFQLDGALDMRMDQRNPQTAAALVARLSEGQLADVFYHFGEERQARRIARFLVQARQKEPITTTARLAAIVAEAIPKRYHPLKVHVATKVFQALRIAVNTELVNLADLLAGAPEVLRKGARICVITFHSLEDRMVKRAFADNPTYRVLTRHPVEVSRAEVERNPRSRSAKLRVAARV